MRCPPELIPILHEHVERFGIAADGWLFTGEPSPGGLPTLTVTLAGKRA